MSARRGGHREFCLHLDRLLPKLYRRYARPRSPSSSVPATSSCPHPVRAAWNCSWTCRHTWAPAPPDARGRGRARAWLLTLRPSGVRTVLTAGSIMQGACLVAGMACDSRRSRRSASTADGRPSIQMTLSRFLGAMARSGRDYGISSIGSRLRGRAVRRSRFSRRRRRPDIRGRWRFSTALILH